MEPSIQINLYPLNYYGFGLYKPTYRNEFEAVLTAWKKVTPNVGYGNFGNWLHSEAGVPWGPGLEIAKFEIPLISKYDYKTVSMYGSPAWGYAALLNYLVAKQEWDPSVDVEAVYREWLQLAYGDGWKAMDRIYRMLDERIKDYKITKEPLEYRGTNYEATWDLIQQVHLPRLAEIESLSREAWNQAKTEKQRKRLQMFADNMIVFHRNLRRVDALPHPGQSVFYRSDADFDKFVAENQGSLALCADTYGKTIIRSIWAVEKRRITIPRVAGAPPVADGEIKEGEWRGAGTATDFRRVGTRDFVSQPAKALVLFDNRHLYIAFECMEDKAGEIKAEEFDRDQSRRIFSNDTVEIFFNPTGEKGKDWHLAVNPKNCQWDGYGANSTPNLKWTSAAKVSADRWVAEFVIPFANFGVEPPAGKTWRGNFGRGETPHKEYSSWCSVEQFFVEPEHFGEWVFAE